MKTTNILTSLTLCLVAAPSFAQTGEQQSELARRHYAQVRTKYDAAKWTRGERREGLSVDLELEGLVADALRGDKGFLTRTYRHEGAERPSLVVESLVARSAQDAHEMLVTWLAGLQSTGKMPSARELGVLAGDEGFVGRSGAAPGAIAWIAFVRGNVAVRVTAFDPMREPALDMARAAHEIDVAILSTKTLLTPSQVITLSNYLSETTTTLTNTSKEV